MLTKIEMQAMEAVIGIHREMRQANEVNWEQRRYEIAKEVMGNAALEHAVDIYLCGLSHTINGGEKDRTQYLAKTAVALADALIDELKKDQKQ